MDRNIAFRLVETIVGAIDEVEVEVE